VQLKVVMAGLEPAIHALAISTGDGGNRVDARVEPAHDKLQLITTEILQRVSVPGTALSFREGGDGARGAIRRR